MAEEVLNTDHCTDTASIRAKLEELRILLDYANDLAPRASAVISELEGRLLELGEETD